MNIKEMFKSFFREVSAVIEALMTLLTVLIAIAIYFFIGSLIASAYAFLTNGASAIAFTLVSLLAPIVTMILVFWFLLPKRRLGIFMPLKIKYAPLLFVLLPVFTNGLSKLTGVLGLKFLSQLLFNCRYYSFHFLIMSLGIIFLCLTMFSKKDEMESHRPPPKDPDKFKPYCSEEYEVTKDEDVKSSINTGEQCSSPA